MASVTTSALTELGGKFVLNRDAKGSDQDVTSQKNVLSGSGTIFLIEVDNEANSSAVFLKIVDSTTATPSTSTPNGAGTPDHCFIAPAHTKMCYSFPAGLALSTGLTYWVTTSKSLGTSVNPSSAVIVKILCA
jgi:hypothetical protein|tara:strand:- start:956 stop:1354 length:399 start_codon:yes stop_codon:yes gene_type:complete